MSIEVGERTPGLAALMAEQERVQRDKHQKRRLDDYDFYTFQRSIAVSEFLTDKSGASGPSVPSLLHGISESKTPGDKAHWVDMCGGMGLAMREFANLPYAQEHVETTHVDLFDYPLDKLKHTERDALEAISPGMLSDRTKPIFIQADAETVRLPKPADLLTSIEGIEYLNNPLSCIVNWYNQLEPNGLMVISAGHDWAENIRYAGGTRLHRIAPTAYLLHEFAKHGISYAIDESPNPEPGTFQFRPESFSMLAVQRRPGTSLTLTVPLNKIHADGWGYKTVYYEEQTGPPIDVTQAPPTDRI